MREIQRKRKRLSYWQAVAVNIAAGLVIGLIIGLLLVRFVDARLERIEECSYSAAAENRAETRKTAYAETLENVGTEERAPELVSIGEFRVTAYCPCVKCCGKSDGITATGTQATQGRTIAVDPDVIPYGTAVYIDGVEYIAEDCGGAIKGNCIDIFFYNHADALQFGVQTKELYIMEG